MHNKLNGWLVALYLLVFFGLYFYFSYTPQVESSLYIAQVAIIDRWVGEGEFYAHISELNFFTNDFFPTLLLWSVASVLGMLINGSKFVLSYKLISALSFILIVDSLRALLNQTGRSVALLSISLPVLISTVFLYGNLSLIIGFVFFFYFVRLLLSQKMAKSRRVLLLAILSFSLALTSVLLALLAFIMHAAFAAKKYSKCKNECWMLPIHLGSIMFVYAGILQVSYLNTFPEFSITWLNTGHLVAGFVASVFIMEQLDLYRLAAPFFLCVLPFLLGFSLTKNVTPYLVFIASIVLYVFTPESIEGYSRYSNQWIVLCFVSYMFIFHGEPSVKLTPILGLAIVLCANLYSVFRLSSETDELIEDLLAVTSGVKTEKSIGYYNALNSFNGAYKDNRYVGSYIALNGLVPFYGLSDRLSSCFSNDRNATFYDPYISARIYGRGTSQLEYYLVFGGDKRKSFFGRELIAVSGDVALYK